MGEITEALRRAKLEEGLKQRVPRDSPRVAEEDSAAAREQAGPATPEPQPASLADLRAAVADAPLDLPFDGDVKRIAIPRGKTGFWHPRALAIDPPILAVERFRHFAVRVGRELDRIHQRAVLVTSALPQEGKTTVSCNLALAFASLAGGGRTALVDLDLHRSAIRKSMEFDPVVGFESVLTGEAPLQAARVATDIPGFDIYAVKTPRRKAHELLSGSHFEAAVERLNHGYEKVVFDAPPVLPVPDVALATNHIPTCVLVTRRGVTRRRSYHEVFSAVPAAKFIGVFLNDTRDFRRSRRYEYYDDADGAEAPEASR